MPDPSRNHPRTCPRAAPLHFLRDPLLIPLPPRRCSTLRYRSGRGRDMVGTGFGRGSHPLFHPNQTSNPRHPHTLRPAPHPHHFF